MKNNHWESHGLIFILFKQIFHKLRLKEKLVNILEI